MISSDCVCLLFRGACMMFDENPETPATVVIVPHQPHSGRARVAKSNLTLAGAVRFVAESMAPAERPQAVIRTPTRSLLFDEIAALYERADVRAASAETDCGRAPVEDAREYAAADERSSRPEAEPASTPPRTALQPTAIRVAIVGMIAVGSAGAAGLAARYCGNDAGPMPTGTAFAVHQAGGQCDEARVAACPGPAAAVSDRHAADGSPAAGTPERRNAAEAVSGGNDAKRGTPKLADKAAGPAAKAAHRRTAAKADPSRPARKFANRYPSMRIGARHVMLDPIALAGGPYN